MGLAVCSSDLSWPCNTGQGSVLGARGGRGWRGSWRQGGKGGLHAPAHQQSFPCLSLFIPCISPCSLRAWRVGRRGLEGELEAGREGRTACTSTPAVFSLLFSLHSLYSPPQSACLARGEEGAGGGAGGRAGREDRMHQQSSLFFFSSSSLTRPCI